MPRRRYRHYMRRLERVCWPGRVLCVAVESQRTEHAGPPARRLESLTGWTCVRLTCRAGVCRRVGTRYGTTVAEWWQYLRSVCTDRCPVQIISSNCTRAWSLLELWQELENGGVTIGESGKGAAGLRTGAVLPLPLPDGRADGLKAAATVRTVPTEGAGGIVLEDPPCIAWLRPAGAASRVTWWDCRNWGCQLDAAPAGRVTGADTLAAWITELCRLSREHRLAPPAITAGCWSMQSYRLSYYPGGVYCHTHPGVTALEEAAYYGGRNEALQIGPCPGDLSLVDVRSAYIHAAAHVACPVRLLGHAPPGATCPTRAGGGLSAWVARVRVATNTASMPRRRDHDVIYPVGAYWTVLAGPELALAAEAGRILEWGESAVYECEPILAGWASATQALRTEAEHDAVPGVAEAIKRSGVSLIGKFAQRQRAWERWPRLDGARRYGEVWAADPSGEAVRYRLVAGQAWRQRDYGYAPDAQVSIAAWITSAARVALYRLICIAGLEHVYYVDTDALIVDEIGLERLQAGYPLWGSVLGGLSVRHGPGPCTIYGLKHYTIAGHTVCAGLPRGVLTDCGDGVHHWYTDGAGSQIDHGQRPSAEAVCLRWPRPETYRHGVVQPDGRVLPHRIEE